MTPVTVTVRYFAAAKAAAGAAEEQRAVSRETTLASLVAEIGVGRPELERVLERCSFLRDEVVVRDLSTAVRGDSIIDVLPPFAGG